MWYAKVVDLRILTAGPAFAVARNDHVLVQIWEATHDGSSPHRAPFLVIERELRDMKQRLRGERPLLVLSVVSEDAPMPDAESRAVASRFAQFFDYYVGVHEGTGFRASLVRSVVAGMALAARVKARYEVSGDLVKGCAALAAHSGGAVDPAELLSAVIRIREGIERPARVPR